MSEHAAKRCITCNKSLDIEEVMFPYEVQCLDCSEFEGTFQAPDDLFDNQGDGGVE